MFYFVPRVDVWCLTLEVTCTLLVPHLMPAGARVEPRICVSLLRAESFSTVASSPFLSASRNTPVLSLVYRREAFSLVELRATVHHLGDIVAAGAEGSGSDSGSSDSGMGGYGAHGMAGRGGGGGGGAGGGWDGSQDESGDWGVEYAWSAQGGAGRHQAPTLVQRMPQAICTNYLRVREPSDKRIFWLGEVLVVLKAR